MKKSLLIIFMAASCVCAYAQAPKHSVPATPHPIEFVQPNGDTLMFRLHGDERRHWQTTLDGYLIKQNKHGRMCYAKQNKKGVLKATCRTAHNAEDRSLKEQRYVEKHISKTYIKTDK